jgi:hypothetical protein
VPVFERHLVLHLEHAQRRSLLKQRAQQVVGVLVAVLDERDGHLE